MTPCKIYELPTVPGPGATPRFLGWCAAPDIVPQGHIRVGAIDYVAAQFRYVVTPNPTLEAPTQLNHMVLELFVVTAERAKMMQGLIAAPAAALEGLRPVGRG